MATSGTSLFAESKASYNGDTAFGSFQKSIIEEYPCTQNYDYDRLRQEAETDDPLNPKTDSYSAGNNAITTFLNKIKGNLEAFPDSATNTCECKCCPKNPLEGLNLDINYDGCCDCELDPECTKQIVINTSEPPVDDCDFETLCNAVHQYAEQTLKDGADYFSNLEDPDTESTDSGSLKDAIIRQVNLVLGKKCVRRKKGKYYFGNLNSKDLPQSLGIAAVMSQPKDPDEPTTDARGNPILS